MRVGSGEVPGSAFLIPRLCHQGMLRTVRGLTRLPSADQARRNAEVAAATLARQRHEREELDHFLAAHAALATRRSTEAV